MPDAAQTQEHRMVRELVAKFVGQELMPLEPLVLKRESQGGEYALTEAELAPLHARCRELGLWALESPEEYGGANLPAVALAGVEEELARSVTPFIIPPDSPNLHMLMAVAKDEQRAKYLAPYAAGRMKSCIAISEPIAGGDPSAMITRAVQDGEDWVINGRKIWVSNVPGADFVILMARTSPGRREQGVSAFIVEAGTPGFIIGRQIAMIGGRRTHELVFEDCRVPARNMLGGPGAGYAPMQLRLNVRRLQMGARCIGISRRALEMMCAHAGQRVTFGVKLAERQAIQWWIAEASMKIHACRLMVQDAAARLDRGENVKDVAGMIKVYATEMASEIVDRAMQTHGAMGVTKELPLQLFAQQLRLMRVYEGPTEVHMMAIARRTLKQLG